MTLKDKRLHLMGIGGSGMTGIAIHALAQGATVDGCDPAGSNATLDAAGIKVLDSHSANHVADHDLIGASTAIHDDHSELMAARDQSVPVMRRGEILRAITEGKKVISVSGTHGKTTTTAMIAHAMRKNNIDVSFLVGGNAPTLGGGVGIGSSEWFVLEGDESDASFLGPQVEIAVVTNIEPDHLDFYGDYESLREAFDQFIVKANQAIICSDGSDAAALAESHGAGMYGFKPNRSWQIHDLVNGASGASAVARFNDQEFKIELSIPGEHSILNATAALFAVQLAIGKVAEGSLLDFQNVDRRFSIRSQENGVTIIDDYAHLPTEVEAVLEAASLLNARRLVVAFQPHRYSRTASIHSEFANSFERSDLLVITDVYAAGEEPRPGISGKLIVDDVLNAHADQQTAYLPNRIDVVKYLSDRLRPGDVLMTLGAGDITKLNGELLEYQNG